MWISALMLLLIFISISRKYKRGVERPSGLQSAMEPIILFVRDDIANDMIGKGKADKYFHYLLTVFFFIWINNILGLVPFFPGGSNLSGNISFTAVLAICTLIITNVSGTKAYWKHIVAPPGVPAWVTVFLVPVEIIGIFTKPFALMIRLFANITAGHIILLSLVSMIFILKTIWFAPVSILLGLVMSLLEILVGLLQAFIFTLLSALFIGLATHDDSH
jgi:F-type H+-transporting ATPase subunit a